MQHRHENRIMSTFLTPAKFIIPGVFLFFAVVLPSDFRVAAQGSELEKSVYEKPADTKTSPPKKSNSKSGAKKSSPSPAASQTTSKSSTRKGKTSAKPARKSPSDLIAVTFRTPGPNQEVWLGEMKLGVSNAESELVKSIKVGVYLVTLKETGGDVLVRSQLVSVTSEKPSIDLKSEDDLTADRNSAEENPAEDSKEGLEASENILAILAKYADPKATATVSTEDWNYVLKLAQTNRIKGFTQVQIEAQKWFASGQIELSKKNYADALTAFQSAKTFMAGSAYPDYAIGETYYANNQINDALRFYTSAVTIQPTFALAHGRMGDIYAKLNRSKEAASSYTTAVQNGFDSPVLRFSLAKEQMKNKRWDEAAVQLEVLAKAAPDGDVFLTLGDLYTEQKRAISAYEAYKKATELLPGSSVAFYKLGEILFEEKEYVRARAAFGKAIELDAEGKAINVGQAKKYLRESEQKLK